MSAGTAQPELAWQWMVFLTRQPPIDTGTGVVMLPARRSVAEAAGFWTRLDPDLARALRYAADHALPWHRRTRRTKRWTGQWYRSWARVRRGRGSRPGAAQALADVQTAAARPRRRHLCRAVLPRARAGRHGRADYLSRHRRRAAVDTYRDLAALFAQDHPDIVVDVVAPTLEQSLADLAAAADCFEWAAVSPGPDEQPAILSLDPLLDADPAFPIDDFYPQLLDSFRREGRLWGLPSGTTPYVIEYNKDLFDAAGVAYPAPGWTTDDFLAAAVR